MTSPTLDTGGTVFKTLLWIVTVIFGVAFIAWAAVGLCLANPTPPQANVEAGLDWVVKLGFGAIVGLLGGKAA